MMFLRRMKANANGGTGDRSVFGNFWFSNQLPGSQITTPDSALALTPVYACVKVLAESFACIPFSLYKPSKDGTKRTKLPKHWVVRLFTKAPNRFQTAFEWRMMLMGHLALRGNAFCQIQSNERGEITELLPLNPDRMTIETLASGEYRYRYLAADGSTVYYKRGEVWHLRGLSSDGLVGISPISACKAAINEGLSMQSYSNRFYENDAKPGGGWIESPARFKDSADKQEFRDSWQAMQGGANRGKIAVLEDGMKFHELGLSNTDSQFVEARRDKVSDVCRIFRVPPHMVSDLSRATFSNIEQQSIDFWSNTMKPWAMCWKASVEFFLLGEELGLDVEFDVGPMQVGDMNSRYTAYSVAIFSGWITRNEVRARENMDPLGTDLDEPIAPINMIPADKLGEPVPAPGGGDAPSNQTEPDKPPPGKGTKKPKKAPKPAKKGAADDRLMALIVGNAGRMARRIVAGSPPDAETLAGALAIETAAAAAWLADVNAPRDSDPHWVEGELLALAFPPEPTE